MKQSLSIAIKAALDAGAEILKVYNSNFEVETKEDDSPLTLADKNANSVINEHLRPTGIPIISEENKQINYGERKKWKRCWIVDPLDGTKEFIKRNGEFTVNIALVEEGHPVLGVIYVPVTKTLYFASTYLRTSKKIELKSEDTFINYILTEAKNIKPKPVQEVIKIVGSRSHLNQETEDFIQKFLGRNQKVEIVSKGSSLKFCLVAEGEAHIYPRFGPTMEWDTAAGDAICRMAGLQVIDQDTGGPLLYNKRSLLNNYFLIST